MEKVVVFVNGEKMTSDTGPQLRLWIHKKLARTKFADKGIMSPHQFDKVAWEEVYKTLHEVPRMFQIWAGKQVTEIARTNANIAEYKDDHSPYCPSCDKAVATCSHVLRCQDEGRVIDLQHSIGPMKKMAEVRLRTRSWPVRHQV